MLSQTGTQEIETKRLFLRRFTLSDSNDVFQNWMSDGEVTKYLQVRKEITEESTESVVAKWVDSYKSPEFYNWAITLRDTNELIGHIEAFTKSDYDAVAGIGYCIGRRFWNHGYATEALTEILHYLLEKVNFNRVEASHSVNNPASGHVMKKSGMTFEGISRQNYRCRLGFQDSCVYSILRDDLSIPTEN